MKTIDETGIVKKAIKLDLFSDFEFIKRMFTIPVKKDAKSKYFYYKDKDFIILLDNEEYLLEDVKFPILDFRKKITLTNEDLSIIDDKVETRIGSVIVNYILLYLPFKNKFKYNNDLIDNNIEIVISEKLIDNGDNIPENKIPVKELIKFIDNASYLKSINKFFVTSATPKTMVPAPYIVEAKKKIIADMKKEYGDDVFSSQAKIIELEERLKQIDREFLKDDPSFGIVTGNKTLNNARKELYLTMGGISGFGEDVKFVEHSLIEGYPTDPELLTAMFNTSREGSYARGTETQDGGYFAKIVLRAAGSIKVTDKDCGTKLGVPLLINKNNLKTIVNRNIIYNGVTYLINNIEEANEYLNKNILLRSPKYCMSEGETLCPKCVDKLLSMNPDGISLELTSVTSIVLNDSLKKMHNTTKSVVTFSIDDFFS